MLVVKTVNGILYFAQSSLDIFPVFQIGNILGQCFKHMLPSCRCAL